MKKEKMILTKLVDDTYKLMEFCELIFHNQLKSEPLISICIPTFDRQDYLIESVKSALNQVDFDVEYEIIVICDDPDNNSFESILKGFNSTRISYYRNRINLGLFENLNIAVRLANSQWVSFLHDDDLLNSNYLHEITRLLQRRNNMGAIMVTPKQIGLVPYRSKLRQSSIYKFLKPIKDNLSVGKLYKLRIIDNILWCADQYGPPTCGSLFRKDFFIELNGYNKDTWPSGDWYFMIEFNKHFNVYKTTEQLGQYRWGINESMKPSTIKAFVEDNLKLREYFKETYFFGKIVSFLTRKEHYKHVIDVFLSFDKTNTLKPTDFDYIMPYPKNSLKYFIYLNSQRAYWVFRVLISLVIG